MSTVNFQIAAGDDTLLATQELYRVRLQKIIDSSTDQFDAVHKGYVDKKISDLVGGASSTLDTLKEIEVYLTGDANTGAGLLSQIAALRTEAATESTTRKAAETALGVRIDGVNTTIVNVRGEIDATQLGAGLGLTGQYTADSNTNYLSAASSLKDADFKLDAAVKAQEVYTDNKVATEVVARALAINTESTERKQAEGVLGGKINANKILSDEAHADREAEIAAVSAAKVDKVGDAHIQGALQVNSVSTGDVNCTGIEMNGGTAFLNEARVASDFRMNATNGKYMYFSDKWRLYGAADGSRLVFEYDHGDGTTADWKSAIPFIRS